MKKIVITLLAAFTVSAASGCEFCDTVLVLEETYDVEYSIFYLDTISTCIILCEDEWIIENNVTSYPWGCWENIPVGNYYFHNNKLKKKYQEKFGEAK